MKKNCKIISLVSVILILLNTISLSALASENDNMIMEISNPVVTNSITNGQCGDNAYRYFDENTGILTISGSGDMWDYASGRGTTVDNKIKSIVIENGITNISNFAFDCCQALTTIDIPNSVKKIESFAFSSCESLKKISIPDSVQKIGESAFENCSSLQSITIGDSVVEIGNSAFRRCTNLENVIIGNGLSIIPTCAFKDDTSLKSISIGKNVDIIEEFSFEECDSLISIDIPDNVTEIRGGAFGYCDSLKSLKIGNGVKSLLCYHNGYDAAGRIGAFRDCKSLQSVVLGNNLTFIDAYTFYNCTSLTSVIVPSCVNKIEESAFGYYYSKDSFQKMDNFIIYGTKGTIAETYANENGFAFIEVDPTKNGWYQNNNGKWLYFENGTAVTGWKNNISGWNGTWFNFSSSGVMNTGWLCDNGSWYYLASNGAMQTGWVYDGAWYYMNASGVMQIGWQFINGTWYYMNGSGAMQTGWQFIGGAWYCFADNGAMYQSCVTPDGCYVDENGRWVQ